MSFGIALAGGGTRGAAHVGVLLALEENGLKPDSIAGTSAGSIVAGIYAAGKNASELKEIVLEMAHLGKYFIDVDVMGVIRGIPCSLLRREIAISGFIKGNRLEQYLEKQTNAINIIEAGMKVVIPAVDINSGKTIAYTNALRELKPIEDVQWERNIKLSTAMRASASFPAVFQPKCTGNKCLVDGGITNVLPVDLLNAAGEKNIIAVDIGDSYKSPDDNCIFEVVTHSYSIMSHYLKNLASTTEVILLAPPLPKKAGLLTFQYMEECMEIGYEYTKKHMNEIRNAIMKN